MKNVHFKQLAMNIALGTLLAGNLLPGHAQTFSHPCAMHRQADFDRMTAKVNASAEPWLSGWNALLANSHSSATYTLQGPVDTVYRGTGTPENYAKLFNDCAAAYANALRWKIAGTTANADKAIQILNAWASVKVISGTSDKYLAAGLYGYQLANAAEIMRSYSGWTATSFTAFKTMMLNVFYPMNHDFLVNHNGACISHYWANWDLCNMASVMAIGILCDDATKYNEAVTYFKTGAGNGAIDKAVYYVHPGNLGQWQESGRDQGHNTLGVALMGVICEMAWNVGDDLYAYNDNKFMKGCEYIAKYNLGNSVPYVTYNNCDNVNQTVIATSGRGTLRDCWEMVYNHYVNRRGLAAPYTQQYAALVRPEGGGGHYSPNSSGYDQLGYGTLTYTIDPVVTSLSPVADAYVQTGTYANTNFGTATSIVTKAGTGDGYREGYLRFNLSGITGSITDATLRLYVKSKESNSTRSIYTVATDTWTETGITYNNKPAYTTQLTTDSIKALGWVDFEITGYVISQYNSDQLASICIKDPVTNNNIGTDFYSKENSANQPVLIVRALTNAASASAVALSAMPQAEVLPAGVKMYPNPVNSRLWIQLGSKPEAEARVSIFTNSGVPVMNRKITGVSDTVDMGMLPAGVYFVELINGTQKVRQKIVKL